jgi:acyl transferase domain-containing protein
MEPIAIIGHACLFPGEPGGRDGYSFLWLLRDGRQVRMDATAADIDAPPAAFQGDGPDQSYFLRGGYIRRFRFDTHGYHLPAETLERLDHGLQWAVHVSREALQRARITQTERAGVVLGSLNMPTQTSHAHFRPVYDALYDRALSDRLGQPVRLPIPERAPALRAQPASVVAAALNLGGPHLTLDAACASSLYAVGLASDVLNSGRADLMLAGAVSAPDRLFLNIGFTQLGGFPTADRHSLPLDAESDGLIAGEGVGVFVLKRYADAHRDGDRVIALIRGAGQIGRAHV